MSAGSVLVVCGRSETAANIQATLIKEGFYPVSCAHSANEARRQYFYTQPDVLVISAPLPDEQGIDLVYDAYERTSAGIVVFALPEQLTTMHSSLERTGALILPKPINRLTLLQTTRFALSMRKSITKLTSERDELRKRMDKRKIVEKAKWILVEKFNMSEPQAFRYIQKRAMDQRLPQIQVAEEIIRRYES